MKVEREVGAKGEDLTEVTDLALDRCEGTEENRWVVCVPRDVIEHGLELVALGGWIDADNSVGVIIETQDFTVVTKERFKFSFADRVLEVSCVVSAKGRPAFHLIRVSRSRCVWQRWWKLELRNGGLVVKLTVVIRGGR